MQKPLWSLFLYFSLVSTIFCQRDSGNQDIVNREAIQFSGLVLIEGADGEPEPLPYTSIAVLGTTRGTISDIYGFFSFVAETGDTIVFSRIGYKSVKKAIPDSLSLDRYSWKQIMTRDSILLPMALITPRPSREHFKFDFLAIDISNELREQADRNMVAEVLGKLKHAVPPDGAESYDYVFDHQQKEYKYSGQFKPQNIFSPVAWKEFIDAWRRGDFKRKKKDKN